MGGDVVAMKFMFFSSFSSNGWRTETVASQVNDFHPGHSELCGSGAVHVFLGGQVPARHGSRT